MKKIIVCWYQRIKYLSSNELAAGSSSWKLTAHSIKKAQEYVALAYLMNNLSSKKRSSYSFYKVNFPRIQSSKFQFKGLFEIWAKKIEKWKEWRKRHGRVAWMENPIEYSGNAMYDGHVSCGNKISVCWPTNKNFHWNVSLFYVFKKFTLFRSKWTLAFSIAALSLSTSFSIWLLMMLMLVFFYCISNSIALLNDSLSTCTLYIRTRGSLLYVINCVL